MLERLIFGSDTMNLWAALLRLVIAAVLGGFIGSERGRHGRAAGMRTHILVGLGSALTAIVGLYVTEYLKLNADPMRISAQVISGIGFLGAGTILVRDKFQVTGLTTAAGLWATAAIGLAIGVGFLEAGVAAALIVFMANALLARTESKVKSRVNSGRIYAELNDPGRVNDLTDGLDKRFGSPSVQVIPARSGLPGHVGIEIDLRGQLSAEMEESALCREFAELPYVDFAVEIR